MCYSTKTKILQDNRGFTLFEVSVASGLLAVILMGTVTLWNAMGFNTTHLVLKQKAIFVLNGEMERLAALYLKTDFGAKGPAKFKTVSGNSTNYDLLGQRLSYPTTIAKFLASTSDEFITTSVKSFVSGPESMVHVPLTKGVGKGRGAYVWIDRERGVGGLLHWGTQNITQNSCSFANSCECFGFDAQQTNPCLELELAIEFPYRLNIKKQWTAGDQTEIITLRTIVGRY